MLYIYFGTMDRFNDNSQNKRILLTTPGMDYIAMTDVDSRPTGLNYSASLTGIKSLIADINDAHQDGHIRLREKRRRLHEDWIPLTDSFVETWGLHMVPYDIRQEISDVRHHLALDDIAWPAILVLNEDGTGPFVPEDVDAFGLIVNDVGDIVDDVADNN